MKTMFKVLSLAAVLAACAPLALADTISGDISLAGPGTFTVTGNVGTFTDTPPGPGHHNSVTSADGLPFTDFLGAASGDISFDDFTTNELTPAEIFHITLPSGEELIFTGSGFSGLQGPGPSSAGSVNISGTFTLINDGATVYTPASGQLDFAANGQLLNFTEDAYTPSVPEPSSLMLLGTGLLTAVGVARRKLKV